MVSLESIGDRLRTTLTAKNEARDTALRHSRTLVRYCANTIRAVHRGEMQMAQALLKKAEETTAELRAAVVDDPDLYYAGYTQDGMKEWVEANVLLALVTGAQLPTPDALQVEAATYLKGLAEAATELRRTVLDIIREDHSERAEGLLEAMDEIYSLLVTIDFPDAITGGLRRSTDVVRGVRERTRGDLTMSLRQQRLQQALRRAETVGSE
ncbi:MAG: haloacid dehalogenase [Anaerolineaceae bacterium]|nr:haloacid dehalogenase [Anaerolineaceae bacterium]